MSYLTFQKIELQAHEAYALPFGHRDDIYVYKINNKNTVQ